jgi:putative glutamine amidotransferase
MDRDRDFWEESLLFAALKFNKPVLGICRGLQLMNVALGGSLWDDIPSQIPSALKHQQNSKRHLTSHKVIFEPKSQLAAIFGQTEILVNSGHHQGVKELAPFLTVAGRSEDGIVEAVEMMDTPGVIGVQWHPEALIGGGPVYLSLFQALVAIAKKG